jgi:alpha-tubulin suppressor-like RCC1 family protein
LTPIAPLFENKRITDISAGNEFSTILKGNGVIYSYGYNSVKFKNLKLSGWSTKHWKFD